MLEEKWRLILRDFSKISKKGRKLKLIKQQALTYFDENYPDILGKFYASCRAALFTPPLRSIAINPLNCQTDYSRLKISLLDHNCRNILLLLNDLHEAQLGHESQSTNKDEEKKAESRAVPHRRIDFEAASSVEDNLLDTTVYLQTNQYYGDVPHYLQVNNSLHINSVESNSIVDLKQLEKPLESLAPTSNHFCFKDQSTVSRGSDQASTYPECFLLDPSLSIDEVLDDAFPSNITKATDAFCAADTSAYLLNLFLDLRESQRVLILNCFDYRSIVLASFQLKAVDIALSIAPRLHFDFDRQSLDCVALPHYFDPSRLQSLDATLAKCLRFTQPLQRLLPRFHVRTYHDLPAECKLQSFDKVLLFNPDFEDRKLLTQSVKVLENSKSMDAALQQALVQLEFAWSYVRKGGGELIYATQTLNSNFNERVIQQALPSLHCSHEVTHPELWRKMKHLVLMKQDCAIGSTVVPQLQCNIGPLYVCKLLRSS